MTCWMLFLPELNTQAFDANAGAEGAMTKPATTNRAIRLRRTRGKIERVTDILLSMTGLLEQQQGGLEDGLCHVRGMLHTNRTGVGNGLLAPPSKYASA